MLADCYGYWMVSRGNINGVSPTYGPCCNEWFWQKHIVSHNECVCKRNYGFCNRVLGRIQENYVRCTVIWYVGF